jgi:Membrane bound beta barrel domain (DUF5777)
MVMHRLTVMLLALVLFAGVAHAQTSATGPKASGAAAAQDDDPDMDPNRAQPDFTLLTLPTTLRLPRHKMAFRVTHRFGRALGQGDFAELVEDLFGLDSGAQIGLEFRYGLIRGGQVGIYRTSDRTIQFFGQYELLSQKSSPLSIDIVANIDGTDNFQDSYSPGLSAVFSREVGERAAFYLQPAWINNSNPEPKELVDDNDTILVGIGGRVNVHGRTYLVFEAAPRVGGFKPDDTHVSFGIEQQAGGHVFQLNFSNGIGTTLAQVARGGVNDWYLGFAISRKFF